MTRCVGLAGAGSQPGGGHIAWGVTEINRVPVSPTTAFASVFWFRRRCAVGRGEAAWGSPVAQPSHEGTLSDQRALGSVPRTYRHMAFLTPFLQPVRGPSTWQPPPGMFSVNMDETR